MWWDTGKRLLEVQGHLKERGPGFYTRWIPSVLWNFVIKTQSAMIDEQSGLVSEW